MIRVSTCKDKLLNGAVGKKREEAGRSGGMDLVSGGIPLQEEVLSVGKVWEQRSSFGAQGVFSGETSLKRESVLDSSGKQWSCDSNVLVSSVLYSIARTCDTPGRSLTSFLSLLPENL